MRLVGDEGGPPHFVADWVPANRVRTSPNHKGAKAMRSNTSQKNTSNKKNLRFRRWVAGCLGAFAAGMLGVTAVRSEYIFVVIDLNKPYTPMVFDQPAGGGDVALVVVGQRLPHQGPEGPEVGAEMV